MRKDVIDIELHSHESKDIFPEYSLYIEQWTPRSISIRMMFTDPLIISLDKNQDQIYCLVKDPNLFISDKTGIGPDSRIKIEADLPRQLPNWVNATEVLKDAVQTSNSFNGLTIVHLLSQILLKGKLDDLWNMFFSI